MGSASYQLSYALGLFGAAQMVSAVLGNNISYIIEPFEFANHLTEFHQASPDDNLTLLATNESYIGRGALAVLLDENRTELGHIVNAKEPSHNCMAASGVSLWYRFGAENVTIAHRSEAVGSLNETTANLNETTAYEHPNATLETLGAIFVQDSISIQVGFFDDANCSTCTDRTDLELHYSKEMVLNGSNNEWRELFLDFDSASWTSNQSVPAVGNGVLDLDRLRGWSIVIKGHAGLGEPKTLYLDHLACVGPGELLNAALMVNYEFEEAIRTDSFNENYYVSDLSRNQTKGAIANGTMQLQYLVQHLESWGGFIFFEHLAPAFGYYNLSQATSITLGYNVKQAAVPEGRLDFRLILSDVSDCNKPISATGENPCRHFSLHEHYYGFYYFLDETGNNTLRSELEGSSQSSSSFWKTGWSGGNGDDVFHPSLLKGFRFLISINDIGELNSSALGAVDFGPLGVDFQTEKADAASCVVEPMLRPDETAIKKQHFEQHKFRNDCCDVCGAIEGCVYSIFIKDVNMCYVSSQLLSTDFHLVDTSIREENFIFAWKDDPSSRGDFCSVCECDMSDFSIDCRGKDLVNLPGSFSEEWAPQVLDLRHNDRLTIIGTHAFATVALSIQEIRLPRQLTYFAPFAASDLPSLKVVSYEAMAEHSLSPREHAIQNVQDSSGLFGHVCCDPGEHIPLSIPQHGLTFCDMQVDRLGVDSAYDPYVTNDEADILVELRGNSKFMSEASEDAEKCAEYLQIHSSDKADDFADENRTIPGRISGRPPRTRREIDGARVFVSTKHLSANYANGYSASYNISIGSAPLRGAVWIEPTLHTNATVLSVSVHPSRISLHKGKTSEIVIVHVKNTDSIARKETVLLVNKGEFERNYYDDDSLAHQVVSCDRAFSSIDQSEFNDIVKIEITPKEEARFGSILLLCGGLFSVFLFLVILYFTRRRSLDDVWIVKSSELHLDDPPEFLGQGTFGLVLKARYRGTDVALKRVMPPQRQASSRKQLSKKFAHVDASLPFALTNNEEEDGTRSSSYATSSGSRHLNSRLKKEFMDEMRQLSKLRHPCICTLMGAVVSGPDSVLVMELMELGSLYDILHNDTMILDGDMILPILQDISQGMRFLHTASPAILHGDLKCQNVLVDDRLRAKVADFGLSAKSSVGSRGTPLWMAPELLAGNCQNTPASDIYSFGIMLYEVYSRKEPYEGENTKRVLAQVANPKICKRPPIPSHCPPAISSLMADCVVHEPELRPGFEEVDSRLKRFSGDSIDPGDTQISSRHKKAARNENLLFQVFPRHVAEALREGRKIEPDRKELVSVFFSDIVGFTTISSTLSAEKMSDMLDRLYTRFDELSVAHDVYKLETIGDAYMCVTNLVKDQPEDHVKRIALFSRDAIEAANQTLIDPEDPALGFVQIRCGFHVGPVVARVIGTRVPKYSVYGDVVNTSSRMESNSLPLKTQCSERAAQLLSVQAPEIPIACRGAIDIKGKGMMTTYFTNEFGGSYVFDPDSAASKNFHSSRSMIGLDP